MNYRSAMEFVLNLESRDISNMTEEEFQLLIEETEQNIN